MEKQEHTEQERIRAAHGRLFDVAAELRALAYLFETQGTKANQIAELDMDEISHGLGRIFKRLAGQIRRASWVLDKHSPEVRGARERQD